MRTYKDLFEETLREQISAGGPVETVVDLVTFLRRFDPVGRQFAFDDWLQEDRFICQQCGVVFRPERDSVDEESSVVCVFCARGR
jgi:hypothetical protein